MDLVKDPMHMEKLKGIIARIGLLWSMRVHIESGVTKNYSYCVIMNLLDV